MGTRQLKHIKYIYKGEMHDDDTPETRKAITEAYNEFLDETGDGIASKKMRKFFNERDGSDGSLIYVLWAELPKIKNGDDEIILLRSADKKIERIILSQEQMKGLDALTRAFISEVTAEQI